MAYYDIPKLTENRNYKMCFRKEVCFFSQSELYNMIELYPKANGFGFDSNDLACPQVHAVWTRGKTHF